MVEVFKTNVINPSHATTLINQIHENFRHYKANFDLDDCDKILRVKSLNGVVQPSLLIDFLRQRGFYAEVLDDFYPCHHPSWNWDEMTGKN